MRKLFSILLVVTMLLTITGTALADKPTGTPGFDQYGYNDTARIFNGLADGVDNKLDGMVWGDPTYAKDHLVMKWNAAWDACNVAANDPTICAGAWTDNEYNGKVPGGSGEIWHYKIVWVGPCLDDDLTDGGYCVWGNYEVILSQGTANNVHSWDTLAGPAGYGAYK